MTRSALSVSSRLGSVACRIRRNSRSLSLQTRIIFLVIFIGNPSSLRNPFAVILKTQERPSASSRCSSHNSLVIENHALSILFLNALDLLILSQWHSRARRNNFGNRILCFSSFMSSQPASTRPTFFLLILRTLIQHNFTNACNILYARHNTVVVVDDSCDIARSVYSNGQCVPLSLFLSIWPVLTSTSHAKYSYKYIYFRKVGQFYTCSAYRSNPLSRSRLCNRSHGYEYVFVLNSKV